MSMSIERYKKETVQIDWNAEDFASEPANKATVLLSANMLDYIHKNELRSGTGSLTFLDATTTVDFRSVAFQRDNPYFESINEKIGDLISSGIVNYYFLLSKFVGDMRKEDAEGPQILTMEHLEIGFLICSIPLVLAITQINRPLGITQIPDSFHNFLD